jgi:DNA-binding LacI/PurR family transcriptional regulator
VILGASLRGTNLHCVDSQNIEGARKALQHLRDLGHERIAIVNGPIAAPNCQDRHDGYVAKLREEGLPVRSEYILVADTAMGLGKTMQDLAALVSRPNGPTAVLACGYYIALDVIRTVKELGKRIPQDVSLISFDDTKSAAMLNPPLTVVRQPLEEMGSLAYERIVQLAAGGSCLPRIDRLSMSLICRESTAPPP